jgi:hypothetical protein
MARIAFVVPSLALALALGACGNTVEESAATGGGTGVVAGALVGGPIGAVVGGAAGAAAGTAVEREQREPGSGLGLPVR